EPPELQVDQAVGVWDGNRCSRDGGELASWDDMVGGEPHAAPPCKRTMYSYSNAYPVRLQVMPRRRSLTTAAIAAAALVVIDRDGTAGLFMRVVAAELHVGTMSLYRYVSD